jgi:hypothetical protein
VNKKTVSQVDGLVDDKQIVEELEKYLKIIRDLTFSDDGNK